MVNSPFDVEGYEVRITDHSCTGFAVRHTETGTRLLFLRRGHEAQDLADLSAALLLRDKPEPKHFSNLGRDFSL